MPNPSSAPHDVFDLSKLTPELAAERPLPGTKVPVGMTFDKSGRYLYFMFPESGKQLDLFRVEIATGEWEKLLDADGSEAILTLEEQLRRERLRITWDGLSDFSLIDHPDRDLILINRGGSFSIVDLNSSEIVLDLSDRSLVKLQVSPDGSCLFGVDDSGIVRVDIHSGSVAVVVPRDLDKSTVTVGLAEFVAQEELDRLDGFWISPDNVRIAYAEVDESPVSPIQIAHLGAKKNETELHRYPFAGAPNAKVKLMIRDLTRDDSAQIEVFDIEDGYLARVCWLKSGELLFSILDRAQVRLIWYRYDPTSGNISTVFDHSQQPWVNLPVSVLRFGDSSVLTTVETSGFAHLAVIGSDGSVREVTSGEWMVTEILGVDSDLSWAWICSTEQGPLERHLYRVDLRTGATQRVTTHSGFHTAVFSESAGNLIFVQHSALDASPTSWILSPTGELVCHVISEVYSGGDIGLEPPRFFNIEADSGESLFGALYLPPDGVTEGRPLVVSIYGGPQAQAVQDHWAMTVDLQAQLLAQQGAVVVKLDNRGSYNRGLRFESHLNRRFGTVEIEDQINCVSYLTNQYGIDPTRVGIYGWSYGGYMVLRSMCKAPNIFKVGVSGAPVVDFTFYDTAYTERYLGLPEDGDSYSASSVLTDLDSLSNPVLVIHGLIDENVHFRNTARLMEEIIGKGKKVELLLLPESRHSPRGYETLLEITRRRTSFLLEGLDMV